MGALRDRLGPPLRRFGRSLGRRLSDGLFRATTRPFGPARQQAAGLAGALAPLIAAGWRIRSAGPRWFAVWEGDDTSQRARRILVLPAPWIGLSAGEYAAILALRLDRLGLARPDRGALAADLHRARRKLAAAQRYGG